MQEQGMPLWFVEAEIAAGNNDYELGLKRWNNLLPGKEQSFAAGACPNCGHDWTAHSDFIARGEKVCWTFDPAIMDERHPYYVADAIASECDVWDELQAVPSYCERFRKLLVVNEQGEEMHTADRPFCADMRCTCHQSSELWQAYILEPWLDGILTINAAAALFSGR